ncbi:SH3 domain-containing protein [Allocoleopsis franciscana]|uniref:SH3 domain-containing protein n=1 Tax=Allocoleopsis franciscana PCC 7113 TaxID=1173027 RepID=K9WMI1_9CYAN|nr:SH3 domain-containing protein [Allocoleopsis franciscana]AFZ21403.1 SH3 domain-containing protein [Allocoleopsis franciscana PCC 7113]
MKFKKNRWQILGVTALSSLGLAIFPKTSMANQAPSLSQTSDGYQVAQATGTSCREVDVNTALNVRQQPGGQVIGTLQNGQNVNISGEPMNGWVSISGPMDGYVFARYLNYCAGAAVPPQPMTQTPMAQTMPNPIAGERISTVPGSNCRRAVSPNLAVRSKPDGEVVGTLDENQRVFIANEGVNGWVPIETPISGFVRSDNLGYCGQ